jgi:yecA family protein
MDFDYPSLEACFRSDVMATQSIGLYQACGFTLAVAGAPEVISPLEWLPCLFQDDRLPDFSGDAAREKTIEMLVRLKDHWTALISQRAPEGALLDLPEGCYFASGRGPSQSTRDFCKGYLSGYRWLQKAWDLALRDVGEEDREKLVCNATIMACLTLLYSDEKGAAASLPDRALPMKPAKAWHLLPALLIETGGFGLDRQKAAPDAGLSPGIREKIGRNALCPCGSGKKYKKCCMN